jgi:hypothetical protein
VKAFAFPAIESENAQKSRSVAIDGGQNGIRLGDDGQKLQFSGIEFQGAGEKFARPWRGGQQQNGITRNGLKGAAQSRLGLENRGRRSIGR